MRPLMVDEMPSESDHTSSARTVAAATLLASLVLAAVASLYWEHLVDDAYISLRYARNLVEGHGLVFNPGERVEGYTNFLWTLVMACAIRAGAPAETAARSLGALASVATVAVLAFEARAITRSRLVTWLAPVMLALSFPFAVWASAGLETPLFTLLVLVGIAEAARARALSRAALGRAALARAALARAALALSLATLTRPEGAIYLLLALGYLIARARGRHRRDVWVTFGAATALIVAPHVIWRAVYYGALLPNTYAAKVSLGEAALSLVPRGLDYLGRFVAELRGWALLGLVGLLLAARERAARACLVPLALPALALAAGVGSILLVGGDGLTAFRFVHPVLPFLFLFVALGIARIAASPPLGPRFRPLAIGALVCVTATALVLPHLDGRALRAVRIEIGEVDAWREMGRWFQANTPPDATIAVVVAGAVPYFSRRPAFDLLGLTDPVIASTRVPEPGRAQAGHERSNPERVLERDPDYVLIGEYALHPRVNVTAPELLLFYRAERELYALDAFRDRYAPRAARTANGRFIVFERRSR